MRCTNPNDDRWNSYGGSGVTVCKRWRRFELFLEDMGKRPAGTSLDRYPDPYGNYEPGNCRWATRQQQQNNMRSNVLLEFAGTAQTIAQWAEEAGIAYGTLETRLKRGWDLERALLEDVHVKPRLKRVEREKAAGSEKG
jgi:hypothetical protein